MNLISYNQAIILTLLSAFFWGTWPISQKFLNKYPIRVYFLELFFFSWVFVWSFSFIVKGRDIFIEIGQVYNNNPSYIYAICICGFLFSLSMIFNFYIIKLIGLTISQPLQQTIALLVGSSYSVFIGGKPENISYMQLIFCLSILILSIFFTYLSHKGKAQKEKKNFKFSKILVLVLISSIAGSSYAFSISYSLRTVINPNGLSVLPFTCIFVVFAFLFVLLSNIFSPPEKGIIKTIKGAELKIHLLCIVSALFHYGGNMLHCLTTGILSSVISWPLGLTSGFWTQLAGVLFGEFKNAKKSSLIFWLLSIVFYIIGAQIIIL